jgi:hypothetical protein
VGERLGGVRVRRDSGSSPSIETRGVRSRQKPSVTGSMEAAAVSSHAHTTLRGGPSVGVSC